MNDEPPTPTVRSRMLAAPITPERLDEHFRAGRVLLDGDPVESFDVPGAVRDSDSLRPA